MPVKEAEATNSLADQGVDVFTMHVDSPKVVVETAEKRGIFVCGYHASQAALAPKGYLTGAEWNWEAALPDFVERHARPARRIPNFLRGGLKEGFVKMSPYGALVPDARQGQGRRASRPRSSPAASSSSTGPIKDNKGRDVIAAGTVAADRHRAREDELPRRGRHRLDQLSGTRGRGRRTAAPRRRLAAVLDRARRAARAGAARSLLFGAVRRRWRGPIRSTSTT